MTDLMPLTSWNFDEIYENHISTLIGDAYVYTQLLRRRGVNPILDGLLVGGEDFRHSLAQDVSEGSKRAALFTGRKASEGLVVVTPEVEVKEVNLGRIVVRGACIEAVTTSSDRADLAELYRIGTDLALSSYTRRSVFAIEKYQPKNTGKSNISRITPTNDPRSVRSAIGSVLPLLDSASIYVRSDYFSDKKQLTEVMSLRTYR